MTVQSTVNKITHLVSDIGQTDYIYDFRVDESDHVIVYLDDVEQSPGDYIVNDLGSLTGGTITISFTTALDEQILILREMPLTQLLDYITYGKFPSATHEKGLDYGVMIDQQLQEQYSRVMRFPVYEDVDPILPSPEANNVLGWNDSEDAVINKPYIGGGNVSSINTPESLDFARFTDGTTIEGRSYEETKTDLSLENVDNIASSQAPIGNTNVMRSSGGDIFGHNYNFDAEQLDAPISDIMCGFNDDGYIYKMSPAHVKSQLGIASSLLEDDPANVSAGDTAQVAVAEIDMGTVIAGDTYSVSGSVRVATMTGMFENSLSKWAGTATIKFSGGSTDSAQSVDSYVDNMAVGLAQSPILRIVTSGTLTLRLYCTQRSGGTITVSGNMAIENLHKA